MIIGGAEQVVRASGLLLLGEMHGTKQAPEAVLALATIAARLGAVRVGLEFPVDEQPRLAAFQRDGDRAALMTGFWRNDFQDGRTSAAMADLVVGLRALAQSADVALFAFDDWTTEDRDAAMAQHVLAARRATPGATMIVLAGNLHTATKRRDLPWQKDYAAMGSFLVEHEAVLALDLTFRGGTSWSCGSDNPGRGRVRDLFRQADHGEAPHVRPYAERDERGYDGDLYLGDVEASPPAIGQEP